MKQLSNDDMCFACGPENPIGLKLRFHFEGEEYVTEFEVRPEHQGWAGIMHGGLLTTLLDEVMARLLWERQSNAITAKLEVRFLRPVAVGERLVVRGRIVEDRGRRVLTRAEALGADQTAVATAEALSLRL
jgi:uncharacterized protein (TIGR00369 family)